jgi:1,4-dihydroxy-6-naphthoate synthase
METIRIAYSTCPNDTFIFQALVHGEITQSAIHFEVELEDIAALNAWAKQGTYDVIKVSAAVLPALQHEYVLLESGSALGNGCGPLLVSRPDLTSTSPDLQLLRIGIPGWDTTAYALLRYYAQTIHQPLGTITAQRFDTIMPAILSGELDAGVIIHESRFVYPQLGLALLQDLGEFWEQQQQLPIPLGVIVAHRRLGAQRIDELNNWIGSSIDYAWNNPAQVMPYVCSHAQEMDIQVAQAHIDLYVNDYTRQLGPKGHLAIQRLLDIIAA